MLQTKGATFINLQYGDCTEELASVLNETGITIHDWDDADPLSDLENFTAQIAALDLVITIDNSTAHFAGGLGIPCWVMIPYATSWIWCGQDNSSPWYPSVTLFSARQEQMWHSLIKNITVTLSEIV